MEQTFQYAPYRFNWVKIRRVRGSILCIDARSFEPLSNINCWDSYGDRFSRVVRSYGIYAENELAHSPDLNPIEPVWIMLGICYIDLAKID